jgi:hypothetical protein
MAQARLEKPAARRVVVPTLQLVPLEQRLELLGSVGGDVPDDGRY